MLGRLIVGIIKGLIVGGLIGFGLLKLGFAVMPQVLAYVAAAVTGVVIGLVAGKPIWAKDAKIEAGMKAFVGALLGAGLMFAVIKWLNMPLMLPEAATNALGATKQIKDAGGATLATFSMTSLAMIAAVLGGFYDADNTPEPEADKGAAEGAKKDAAAPQVKANGANKRIATPPPAEEELDDELEVGAGKKAKK
jgi:hypothetical protein